MRKFVVLAFLSALSLSLSAQVVEKTYYFDKPSVVEMADYQQIVFEDCMQSALAGQPVVPWHSVSLLLPPATKAASVEVVAEMYEELEGSYNLYPYQPSRPYSDTSAFEFVKDEKIYSYDGCYPMSNFGTVNTQHLNGFVFAFSSFTPVRYNPVQRKVSFARKVTVRVTVQEDGDYNQRMLRRSPEIDRKVAGLAQNPELMGIYAQTDVNFSGYDILVVTPQGYVSDFNGYKAFYEARGLRTKIISTDSICSDPAITGVDNPEKIRNFVIREYMNKGISMLLLGGDVQHVPYRGLYCYVQSGSGYSDNGIPADLYYAALDGTWNSNGNELWGEIGEEDLLPEIGVARMPFDNSNDLDAMLHKVYAYQNTPVLGEFTKTVLAGEHLYDNPYTTGSDYLELLIGTHSDNGYTTHGIPATNQYTRLYEQMGNWSGANLRNAINDGQPFVHHDGHANYTYLAGWNNNNITNNFFYGANGVDHNYIFFHTSGCMCGGFDQSDCIMERMVAIDNCAVSVLGNSRYGWFNEGSTEGPSIHLHREMVDALYHERIPFLGMALSEAKIQTAPWVSAFGQWEEGALRWNFYDLNIIGDVAVCPWNKEPITPSVNYFQNVVQGIASTNVTVSDGDELLSNFRCSVFKDGQLLGFGITGDNGQAVVSFNSSLQVMGSLTLVVTGPDAFPQTFYINSLSENNPFVIVEDFQINDDQFDADNVADNGESFSIDLQLKNLGGVASGGLTASVHADSPYVVCTDSVFTLSGISAGNMHLAENKFYFTIADSVPDGHLASIIFSISDGNETWNSLLYMPLSAPVVQMSPDIMIADGDNLSLDPGDDAQMLIDFTNTGSSVIENLNLNASFSDSLVRITSAVPVVTILPDSTVRVPFDVSVDPLYDGGLPATLNVSAVGGLNDAYAFTFSKDIIIGTMATVKMHDGTVSTCYSRFTDSRGMLFNYNNNEDKTLTINPSSNGKHVSVTFYEFDTRDTLYAYDGTSVDDALIGKYIGTDIPPVVSATTESGALTFRFVSDGNTVASGWVAMITCVQASPLTVSAYASPVFINPGETSTLNAVVTGGNPNCELTYQWTPTETLDDPTSPTPIASPTETTTYVVVVTCGNEQAEASVLVTLGTSVAEATEQRFMVYPNPASDVLNIVSQVDGNYDYMLVNALGQKVKSGVIGKNAQVNLTDVPAGLYFVRLFGEEDVCTLKVLVTGGDDR